MEKTMDNAFMDTERRIYDAASLACELKDIQQVARFARMLDALSKTERQVESYLANNHRRIENYV